MKTLLKLPRNCVIIFLLFPFISNAQITGIYKVGERVLVDLSYTGKFDKTGTVIEIVGAGSELTCCHYLVKVDNDDPAWKDSPRTISPRILRKLNEGEVKNNKTNSKLPPQKQTNNRQPNNEPPNFDHLADREIVDCHFQQKKVSQKAAPDEKVLRKLVQCLFERRAPAGMTGATTMDISSFQIGKARRWIPLQDIGSGNLNTMVYPIKVEWTQKKYYETYTQRVNSISIFNCYVNAVGEWECGLGQRIKESEIQRIPRN